MALFRDLFDAIKYKAKYAALLIETGKLMEMAEKMRQITNDLNSQCNTLRAENITLRKHNNALAATIVIMKNRGFMPMFSLN